MVVRQPGAGDIGGEAGLAAAQVPADAEQRVGFGGGPGSVGLPLGGEGAGGAALPALVEEDRGVARFAVDADPTVGVTHDLTRP